MSNKITTEELIIHLKKIYKDKYDYSKVKYINSNTKLLIICPIHGDFFQKVNEHRKGQGCPKCKGKNYQPRR